MSYIQIQDGVKALLSPYRFDVEATGRADLKEKIIENIESIGSASQSVAIAPLDDNFYSVALHKKQGYLLAESVWRYFDYVDNLIWCERANGAEGDRVLIVIVRDRQIRLDGEMPITALSSDISEAIGDGDEKFDIYVHGDVPILKPGEEELGKIALKDSRVGSFVSLEASLLGALDFDKMDMTYPLGKALNMAGLKNTLPFVIGALVIIGVLLKLAFFQMKPEQEIVYKDEFSGYKDELRAPNPTELFVGLVERVAVLSEMITWDLRVAGTNGTRYDVLMVGVGDIAQDYTELQKYTLSSGVKLQYKGADVMLSEPIRLPPRRSKKYQIANLDKLIGSLNKNISLPGASTFVVDNIASNGAYRSASIAITLNDLTSLDLLGVAKNLNGYPLVIVTADVKPKENTYDLTMNLKLIGL